MIAAKSMVAFSSENGIDAIVVGAGVVGCMFKLHGQLTMMLLEGLLKAGCIEEGLKLIPQAVTFAQARGSKVMEPDYHQLEGDLLLMKGPDKPRRQKVAFAKPSRSPASRTRNGLSSAHP